MDAAEHEQRILRSWAHNAAVWTEVVRRQGIASRKLATDQAILDVLTRAAPRRLLDIGCGEGWLTRRMAEQGVDCWGIDAEPALIAAARAEGGGEFFVCDYFDLPQWRVSDESEAFDVCVCNFSLIGEASTEAVFAAAAARLTPGGRLIVQTIHPCFVSSDAAYASGWRDGSWAGFDTRFTDPAPWYFRTLANWIDLYTRHGFTLWALHEPRMPGTNRPASLILDGVIAR